ncbi:MAG TPA: FG-GAP-like repeat-containing protein [bacterium]|nr:FG-GAP-like repeat-containing protein [bacterium]
MFNIPLIRQHRILAVLFVALLGAGTVSGQSIRFKNATASYGVQGNDDRIDGKLSGPFYSCYGHGVAMADVNADGRPDIYISNAVRYANLVKKGDGLAETFYASNPEGGYTESDGARHISDQFGWTGSHGLVFFDYDNDGDYDLYNATTDDQNRLYRNLGSSYSGGPGYYENATTAAGLPLIRVFMANFDSVNSYGYGTRGVAAFDANNDGWMDLYGANWGPAEKRWPASGSIEGAAIATPVQPNEFYLNQGDGTYRRVTDSGATPNNPAYMGTQGCTVIDANEDGNMDIFVAHRNYVAIDPDSKQNVGGPTNREVYNQLFFGDGTGHFTENAGGAGLNTNPANDCNGATFADYDNDGDYDAFVVPKDSKSSTYVRVYQNDGSGHFTDITASLKLTQYGFSLLFLDADNDGDLDIAAPQTRDYTRFYSNNGNGTFTAVDNTGLKVKSFDPRGSAIGDIDEDGDLDIYYADAFKDASLPPTYPDTVGNHLFINTTVTSNRWLKITGRGPKGDMGGFGTKIWVYDRGHIGDKTHLVGYRQVINAYGYLCQNDPVQHFGLGQRDSVDVQVRLLDKSELNLLGVPAGQRLFFSRPRQITGMSGKDQTVEAGVALPQPLVVRVQDAFGNAVYGAGVTFTAAAAGGIISEAQPVYTDAQGYAQVHFLPAAQPAVQSVTAQLAATPGATALFSCTVKPLVVIPVPTTLQIAGGEAQQAYTGAILSHPLQIKVLDQLGAPMAGITVHFTSVSGDGTFPDGAAAVTDGSGVAGVRFQFGAAAGIYEVAAAVDGIGDQEIFNEEALAIPNRAPEIVQWAPADSELFVNGYHVLEFSVRATDADGDSMRYLWLLDEVIAGTDSTFRIYPASSKTGKVEARVMDGTHTVVHRWAMHLLTGVEQSEAPVTEYALGQNYPNPFNPQTQILFQLPQAGRVRIQICNTAGQIVRTLADGILPAGRHALTWDARNAQGQSLPTGLYYYTMESGDFRVVKKMLYVK